MLIRHDLQLVFLHIPKCAGKELRQVLSQDCPEGCLESLFDFEFCPELHRYVDLAHLPVCDLRHRREFRFLEHYTSIGCVRSPYARLRSAATEFYRQRSRKDEYTANQGKLSREQRWSYYRQLPIRHQQQDPRFIHSQPMHRFTHLGERRVVNHLLRCENLLTDWLELAKQLNLPTALRQQAEARLAPEDPEPKDLMAEEISLCHLLYARDFELFNYPRQPEPPSNADWPADWDDLREQVQPRSPDAAEIDLLHYAPLVQWHWGPRAQYPEVVAGD